MKYIYPLFIVILASSLTGCGNENSSSNLVSRNVSNVQNDENGSNLQNESEYERLSYYDYMESVEGNTNDLDDIREPGDSPTQGTTSSPIQLTDSNHLASFSTSLMSSPQARVNNLNIVCNRLNGYILNPGESFSFNNVCGPYGKDDGFEKATILLSNGKKEQGYGGGVCQLSSTLYNVVKNIDNIEINERHNHSAAVGYVPKNEDATVSLQSDLDFKFTNRNSFPIRFEANVSNWKVNVKATKSYI